MKIWVELAYRLLRLLKPGNSSQGNCEPSLPYASRIKRVIGERGWDELRDKIIVDFGCGMGTGSIEMAQHGARRVIGIDIRPSLLEIAGGLAKETGVSHLCDFRESIDVKADVIVSIDTFEHVTDPAGALRIMHGLLKDEGFVLLSFGPIWHHPCGGHFFSIFPWSHLVFPEEAQIRWRSHFKHDGATRFTEVDGGLNMMAIGRFIELIERSDFRFETLRLVPIRPLRWLHSRLTQEFTTALVECKMVKKSRSRG